MIEVNAVLDYLMEKIKPMECPECKEIAFCFDRRVMISGDRWADIYICTACSTQATV